MSHHMPGDELGPCPCGHRQAMCHRVNAAKWCPPSDARVTDEQTFRDFVEWTANLTDQQLADYDWWAHRANARNLLDVAEGGRLYAGAECVCAEINMRHCPVHGQDAWDELVKAADPSVTKDGE